MESQNVTNMTPEEWRKVYLREYQKANADKVKKAKAKWRNKNREHTREYAKKYYAENRDKYKQKYQENKESKSKSAKEYHLTENGKKRHTISYWRRRGIKHDDYEELYTSYIEKTTCEKCGIDFVDRGDGTGRYKCIANNSEGNYDCICCYRCLNRLRVVAKKQARNSALNICTKPLKTQTEVLVSQ
jgi:hypothetical protein